MEAKDCTDTGLADVSFHRFKCAFARSVLRAGLSGEYDFLHGFCVLNGCERIRRLYEVWERRVNTDYPYMFTLPHSVSDARLAWYKQEIFDGEDIVGGWRKTPICGVPRKYASLLRTSPALHLGIFDQPLKTEPCGTGSGYLMN